MKVPVLLLLGILSAETAFGVQVSEDPVMKARALRASVQGIAEADLPPVPRGIVEPPPLPPPEIHPRDTRGYRSARRARRGSKGKLVKRGHTPPRSKKAVPRARRR